MVELVYGHLDDATQQADVKLLPDAKHASLDAAPATGEADVVVLAQYAPADAFPTWSIGPRNPVSNR